MNCKKKLKAARRLILENDQISQGELCGKLNLNRKALLNVLIELCDEELYQFMNPFPNGKIEINSQMAHKLKNYLVHSHKTLASDSFDVKNSHVVAHSLSLIEDVFNSCYKKQNFSSPLRNYDSIIHNLIFEINNPAIFKAVYKQNQIQIKKYFDDIEKYDLLLESLFDKIRENNEELYIYNAVRMLDFIAKETNYREMEKSVNTYYSKLKAKKHNRGCKKDLKKYLDHLRKLMQETDKINPEILETLNYKYGIPREFSIEAIAEIDKFKKPKADEYVNLTEQEIITIDGTTHGCLEDAVSITKKGENYVFGLYVIDPTAYISEYSAVAQEARQRGQSIYVRGLVIPMLPEELSYNLFSLLENQNRHVIAHQYEFSKDFDLINFTSQKALINVNKNYSFSDIDELHNEQQMLFLESLFQLKTALKKQYSSVRNYNRDFKQNTHAEELINYLKIFANHKITEKYQKTDAPFLFCVAEDMKGKVDQMENEDLDLSSVMKRNKTNYTIDNMGYQDLNLDCYARVTTPARNYAAFRNQKLYRDLVIDEKRFSDQQLALIEEDLKKTANHLNKRQDIIQQYTEENNFYYQKVKKMVTR